MTGPRPDPSLAALYAEYQATQRRAGVPTPSAMPDPPPATPAATPAPSLAELHAEYLAQQQPPAHEGNSLAGLFAAPLDVIPGATKIRGAIGGAMQSVGNLLHGQPANLGESIAQQTDAQRRDQQAADEHLPYVTAGVRGASMALTGLAKAPVSAADALIAQTLAARGAAPAAGESSTLIRRVLQSAGRGAKTAAVAGAAGGMAGTVYGAADADGSIGDKLRAGAAAAPMSALLGMGFGTMLPASMAAAERADAAATGRLTASGRAARAAAETIPTTTRRALGFLGEDLAAGGRNPRTMLTAYEEGRIPRDAPIVESGGPKVADLARDVRVLGGEGSARIENSMREMQRGQQGRVRGAVQRAFGGQAPNIVDLSAQMAEERAAQGSPLFEQANRETGLIDHPRFQELIRTPWGRRMWGEAQMMLAQDEHPLPTVQRAAPGRAAPVVAPDGEAFTPSTAGPGATRDEVIPDLRAVHYFRMAIDNALAHPNEFRVKLPNGEQSGTATTVQGQLQRMRNETSGILHGASDTFRQADESWAQNSDRIRALSAGRDFVNGKQDEITSVVRRLPADGPVRDAYHTGALSSVEGVLSDVRDNRDALGRVWETPAIREKYEAALPADRMQGLTRDMTRATERRDLVRRVMNGSNTADKTVGAQRLQNDDMGEAMQLGEALVRQSPTRVAEWLAKQGMKAHALRIGRETGGELSTHLTSPNPEEVLQLLLRYQASRPAGGRPPLPPETLAAIARALGAGAGSTIARQP